VPCNPLHHSIPPYMYPYGLHSCAYALRSIGCRTIDKWCCDYNDEVHSLLSFGAANTETLAELTAAFFSFWAWDFSYGRDVVSIRTGRLLTKNDKVQLEHVLTILSLPTCYPAVCDASQLFCSRVGHAESAASGIWWAWRCARVAS
jgi:Cid1 family poly A polymerase